MFLALAGILKHLPEIMKPEPYWSGLFSEALIIGIIVVGIALAIASILALRYSTRPEAVKWYANEGKESANEV